MKREVALALMRFAGYHDDTREWIRLIVESRVNRAALEEAWRQGQKMKQNGVGCHCPDCLKGRNNVA